MNKLIDKLILFTLSMVLYVQYINSTYLAVPIIAVLSFSALMSFVDKRILLRIVFVLYCGLCVALPVFFFFLPLICYDIFDDEKKALFLLLIFPMGAGFANFPTQLCAAVAVFIFLSWLLSRRTSSLEKMHVEYISLRDSTKEFAIRLENKNKELLEKQDYEVHLATLNERNRIARDIHDNIGHMLSNSILQTGALMATSQNEDSKKKLTILKNTLVEGMENIRTSIHDLHDESIDLFEEVRKLVSEFTFCESILEYDVDSNPAKEIKYTVLAVLKEALANIIKHSNATRVKVILREHPALYQLVVKDNGIKKEKAIDEGIGLMNIEQRIRVLGGNVHITLEDGFTLFISIPKER